MRICSDKLKVMRVMAVMAKVVRVIQIVLRNGYGEEVGRDGFEKCCV